MSTSSTQDQVAAMPIVGSPPGLPNVDVMAHGFDIVAFDPLSPGNCNRGAIFDYRTTEPTVDGSYLVPSSLTCNPIDSTQFDASSTQIFTTYDYQQSVAASIQLSADDPEEGLSFSGSASYDEAEETTASFSAMYVQSSALVQCWRLAMIDGVQPALAAAFVNAVQGLPAEYDGLDGPYGDLLGQTGYGTHYAQAAVFGGRVYQSFTMEQASASQMWSQDIDVNAQASEALAASLKLSANTSTSDYKAFDAASEAGELAFVGGQQGDWDDWVATVPSAPAVVSAVMRPLYTLLTPGFFPDVGNIAVLQANLQAAYHDYMVANGNDPLAGAVAYHRWSAVQTGPAYTLRPFGTDAGKAVALAPPTALLLLSSSATPLAWVAVDPSDSERGDLVQSGQALSLQWVNIDATVPMGFLPTTAWPSCLAFDVNKNPIVSNEPLGKDETWTVTQPFVLDTGSAPLAPLFPGAVVQLRGGSTGGYLKDDGGTAIKTTSNPMEADTLWTLQPCATYRSSSLAFDGTGAGYVNVPSVDALGSGAYPATTIAVSAWVWLDPAGGAGTVVANAGFVLGTGAGDQDGDDTYRTLVAEFMDGAGEAWRAEGGRIPVGLWTYVSITWLKGVEVQAFVSGTQVAAAGVTGQQPVACTPALRMGLGMDGGAPLQGRLGPVTLMRDGYPYGWAGYWPMIDTGDRSVPSYAADGSGSIVGDGVFYAAG